MARAYIPVDRDQQFLVPPDMREWLPKNDFAWFVIDIVEQLDTSALHRAHPLGGAGRAGYDPDMLLGLLLYSYSNGQRSSRQIERLCVVDIAYRVIAANNMPDHTTIARFRQVYDKVAKDLFAQVMELASEAGAVNLGVVALDGTKIAANASSKKNRSRKAIEKLVDEMFEQAAAIDALEDQLYGDRRGDELPEALTNPESRKRILAEIAERYKRAEETAERRAKEEPNRHNAAHNLEVAKAREADRLAKVERQQQRDDARKQARLERTGDPARPRSGRMIGPEESKDLLVAKRQLTLATAKRELWERRVAESGCKWPQANLTDPDSRVLHTSNGWMQGYNAQAIVSEDGFVIANDIWDNPSDVRAYQPLVSQMLDNLERLEREDDVGVVLADAGYHSKENLGAEGPDRLIADGKAYKMRTEPVLASVEPSESPVEANHHRLRTEEGRKLYSKRQHTVEPGFHNKFNRKIDRFLRRGMTAVRSEWNLITTAHNLMKLHFHGQGI